MSSDRTTTSSDAPADFGESAVDVIISAFLETFESPAPGDIDSLCGAHPEHGAEIRRRLAALHRLGLWGGPSAAAPAPANDPIPERLGEFRLLRRLGGGGMGVVYLAEQTTLSRVVALKLIRPEHLYFPGARERFRREVETAAKLQHSNIVPIYTVGEERGIPYFAMERIEGCTLAEVIQTIGNVNIQTLSGADFEAALKMRLPAGATAPPTAAIFRGSWWEVSLRIIREVAHALQHSHERGVLHRDLKPSNILITLEGRVLLFDFGLASSSDATQLTRSGSQIGSVPYMAPEIVAGDTKHINSRADIYSLGVTLYELLTLRSPFLAETVDATQRNILEGDPVPPRKLNITVPEDASIVCLTAMDRDRLRRYSSAELFVRDLDHILERRPILAKPPTTLLKFRRWVERHPTQSVGASLGVLLLTGIPTTVAVLQYLHSSELQESFHREKTQREAADSNFSLAVAAVDQMLTRVGANELMETPGADIIRKRLLEDALQFSQTLLNHKAGDPVAMRQQGNALLRVADIRRQLGDYKNSEVAAREAIVVFEKLAAAEPPGPQHTIELISARRALGQSLALPTRIDEAIQVYESIIQLQRGLIAAAATPEALERHYRSLFEDRLSLGNALLTKLDYNKSLEMAQSALAEASGNVHNITDAFIQKRADAYLLIAQVKKALRLYSEAVEAARAAVATLEPIAARAGARSSDRQRVAEAYNVLASNLNYLGQTDEVITYHKKAIQLREALARDFPRTPQFTQELAQSENNLALAYREAQDYETAEVYFKQCDERILKLAATTPEYPELAFDLANLQTNRCVNFADLGRSEAAIVIFEQGIEELEKTVKRNPGMARLYEVLGLHYNNIAAIYVQRDQISEAEEHYKKAQENLEQALRLAPDARAIEFELAGICNNLGSVLRELHQSEEARPLLKRAIDLSKNSLGAVESTPSANLQLSQYLNDLALLEIECGRSEIAKPLVHEALASQKLVFGAGNLSNSILESAFEHAYVIARNLIFINDLELLRDFAGEIPAIGRNAPWTQLLSAGLFAVCAKNTKDDDQAEQFAKLSIEHLRKYLTLDSPDIARLRASAAIVLLSDREDVQAFLRELPAEHK